MLVAYTRKKTNVNRAPKLAKKDPQSYKRVLVSFGKPFYLLLVWLLIGLLYGISLVGYSSRMLAATLSHSSRRVYQHTLTLFREKANDLGKIRITLPKLKVLIPKFYLPKIKLPQARLFIKILFLLFITAGISLGAFWFFVLKDLPSPKTLVTRNIDVSTKILDRNGVLLYKIYKDENRTIVPLSELPSQVKLATLAAEDAEFYEHPGFSVKGITRAIFRNLEKGELTGGSTITQQLVKNALLTPEKTLTRKIQEIYLALRVEASFSKDQILEMYLNEVSYGGTAYGIEEASEAYFGKDAKDLNIAESAFLAGLPKSPSKYSPFSGNFEAGISRQKDVINLMRINKFINEDQMKEADNYKLTFISSKKDIKAPHFVMYVRSLLAEKYGEEVVETGGLEVVTTLDWEIQKLAEEVVKKEVDSLKRLHVGNGAAVVLDPATGEVLAMVGSYDYFDAEGDGNVNVTLRPRSPGSSIKIVNYSYALSHGFTPASIIDDALVTFPLPGQAPYTPKNYDNTFHGKVTLRSALAQSLNIPAVKVLNSYGVANMIEQGKKMGITTWEDSSRFGLSLTLGGGEVKLLDLAQVYATVANYGKKNDIVTVKKVTNYKGKTLEENTCTPPKDDFREFLVSADEVQAAGKNSDCKSEEVLDPRVAYQLIDILKDNNARAPTFGRNSQLVISKHPEVAVKTGTSNDLRDNLTIGLTRDYVVAIWVGNNDNSPMSRIASGLTGASPIFNKIMTPLLSEKQSYAWAIPPGLSKIGICSYTGSLPCGGCPTRTEWFLQEKLPAKACRTEQIIAFQEEKERRERGEVNTDIIP